MKAMTEQEAIATILVNQRVMRNGSPPISNVLDMIPARLRSEVMDDAQAVIEGLAASRVLTETTTNPSKEKAAK